MCSRQKLGSGRSRLSRYHSRSRSKKSTRCPRACSARTSARYVVACPLPHDEVIARPKMTIFMARLSGGGLGALAAQEGMDLARLAGIIAVAASAFTHGIANAPRLASIYRPQPMRSEE